MDINTGQISTIISTASVTGGVIWAALARTIRGYISAEVQKATRNIEVRLGEYQRKDVAEESQKRTDAILGIVRDDVKRVLRLLERDPRSSVD